MTKRAQQRIRMILPVVAFFGVGAVVAFGVLGLKPGDLDVRQQASGGATDVDTCKDTYTVRFGDNFNLASQSWDRSSRNTIEGGKLVQTIRSGSDDGAWLARRKDAVGDFKATLTVNDIDFQPTGNESATATLRFGRNNNNWFGVTLSKRADKIYVKAESENNGQPEEAAVQPLSFSLPVTLTLIRQGSKASYSVTKDGVTQSLPDKEGVDATRGHVSIITNDYNVTGKAIRARYDNLSFGCP